MPKIMLPLSGVVLMPRLADGHGAWLVSWDPLSLLIALWNPHTDVVIADFCGHKFFSGAKDKEKQTSECVEWLDQKVMETKALLEPQDDNHRLRSIEQDILTHLNKRPENAGIIHYEEWAINGFGRTTATTFGQLLSMRKALLRMSSS